MTLDEGSTAASEDILSDSLQTLYDFQPITYTSSGAPYTYTLVCPLGHQHSDICDKPVVIRLLTPDTAAANWSLHASSIWASSVHLADNIDKLNLESHTKSKLPNDPVRVLELGASAGLPSIVVAKLYPTISATATDYPDEALLRTLSENVERNAVAHRCRVLPFDWARCPAHILQDGYRFDVVLAADTLWNPDLHSIFIDALRSTLTKTPTSRIHVVVGLHTGRYTIQRFLDSVLASGFELESLQERSIIGSVVRQWDVSRESEDDQERRRWVIWIQLKWKELELQ
ncbi:hypothetical protein CVT26_014197 [Gymnopilus dilepis]|uniref:Nicotinamide N-methyltransferase n=1 Tax=Gymnopilus dilepis TaxID=231916 RepID=A0A409VU56_9AGAR|nr:hypothetical protein CVT26_014197 [Gymnopilus dilepis]